MRRTNAQQNLYWYLIEGISNNTGFTKSEVHIIVKKAILGNLDIETSSLSKSEFANFLEKVLEYAKQHGTFSSEFVAKLNEYEEQNIK